MSRKAIAFVIFSSIILGGLSGWSFIRFVVPRLNAIPFLVRYNLAPQSSPLTIYRTEQIRVNEGSDTVATVQKVRPWVVGILSDGDVIKQRLHGAGIIVTSDGIIATTKKSIAGLQTAYVKLFDGTVVPALLLGTDAHSDLSFLKIDSKNLPTAALGFPSDLQLGQRMIIVQPSLNEFEVSSVMSALSSDQHNIDSTAVYDGTQVAQSFAVDHGSDPGLVNGSAVVSLDQTVQGLIDAPQIISVETIKADLNSLLNGGKIVSNTLAVHYQYIPSSLAKFYGIQQGIALRRPDPRTPAVTPGSSAARAGLAEGDIIYKIDGVQIDAVNTLDLVLTKAQPGQAVTLSVISGKTDKTVQLKLDPK